MTIIRPTGGGGSPTIEQTQPADVIANQGTNVIASFAALPAQAGTVVLLANFTMEAPNTLTMEILQDLTTIADKLVPTAGARTGLSLQCSAVVVGGEAHSLQAELADVVAQDIRDITFTRIFFPA